MSAATAAGVEAGERAGPLEARIRAACVGTFAPTYLEIVNESGKHNVPRGSETHFKITIVSPAFEGVPLLQRHRLVNAAIQGDDAALPVHALSISAKTPSQFGPGTEKHVTPACLGGSKK